MPRAHWWVECGFCTERPVAEIEGVKLCLRHLTTVAEIEASAVKPEREREVA